MALSIPNRLHEAVVKLFKLEPAQRDKLLEALRSVKPGASASDYEEKLKELFSEASSEWASEVVSFFFSITNLTDVGVRRDAETVAKDIITAFRNIDNDAVGQAEGESLENFQDFILRVVKSQDSIGIRAKASRLRLEHERVFAYAEIFSDIRTIFPQEGVKKQPKSAVIIHSLKLYSLRNDERDELFFAMDYQNLQELKSATERAIEKHETLASMIESFNLHHVEFGGDE